ncbi:hypothetical protein [Streptomyces sp. PSKA30]|uniref:MmyB family transcriptional regulator n=1 Tax=Streptomyces sp. PSKA30 TaxID=2874597 RepID=UPI0035AE0955
MTHRHRRGYGRVPTAPRPSCRPRAADAHPTRRPAHQRARARARLLFLDPSTQKLFRDWDSVARDTVARLHLEVGRRPWDGDLAALIGDLSRSSAAFEALWAEQDVTDRLSGSYRIESPGLGRLSVGFCTLVPPGEPDQALYLFTPEHEGPPRAVWAAAVARRAGRG